MFAAPPPRPLGLMQEGLAERSARLSADTIAKGEQGRNRPLPAAARRPDRCARAGMAMVPPDPRVFPPAPTRCGRGRTRVMRPALGWR
jgi:hypothetical protein